MLSRTRKNTALMLLRHLLNRIGSTQCSTVEHPTDHDDKYRILILCEQSISRLPQVLNFIWSQGILQKFDNLSPGAIPNRSNNNPSSFHLPGF